MGPLATSFLLFIFLLPLEFMSKISLLMENCYSKCNDCRLHTIIPRLWNTRYLCNIDKATVKLDLTTSVINYPSNSNIDNLNIDHKTLDAYEFNSKETRTVTYTCDRVQPVKVKLALDYAHG